MSVTRPNVPLRYEMATGALLLIRLNTEKFTSTAYLAVGLNLLAKRKLVTGTTRPCCAPNSSMRSVTVPWSNLGSEKVCVLCPSAPDAARRLADTLMSAGRR